MWDAETKSEPEGIVAVDQALQHGIVGTSFLASRKTRSAIPAVPSKYSARQDLLFLFGGLPEEMHIHSCIPANMAMSI
jgi:hypothetical protein